MPGNIAEEKDAGVFFIFGESEKVPAQFRNRTPKTLEMVRCLRNAKRREYLRQATRFLNFTAGGQQSATAPRARNGALDRIEKLGQLHRFFEVIRGSTAQGCFDKGFFSRRQ